MGIGEVSAIFQTINDPPRPLGLTIEKCAEHKAQKQNEHSIPIVASLIHKEWQSTT